MILKGSKILQNVTGAVNTGDDAQMSGNTMDGSVVSGVYVNFKGNVVMMDLAKARREFIVDAVPSMQTKLEAQDRDLQRLLAVSSTLLIACVMAGVVVLTHRSAGPVRNVQNNMKRVAAGELSHYVTLRSRDHFKSLAEDFNLMMRALRKKTQQDAEALEQLAQHANASGDMQIVTAELERLAREKRAALPS